MVTWKKVAIAAAAVYVARALWQAHHGRDILDSFIHPLGGSGIPGLAASRGFQVSDPVPAGSGSTAVVLDLFAGAPRSTKALTNAFRG